MKTLSYKNYTGSVEFSVEDNTLFGKVLVIRYLISYEGKTIEELIKDFHVALDDYLISCKNNDIEPEKPFKGLFNVRIDNNLHEKAVVLAHEENISLNKLVENAIRMYVEKL